jgi:hypothetical protein
MNLTCSNRQVFICDKELIKIKTLTKKNVRYKSYTVRKVNMIFKKIETIVGT